MALRSQFIPPEGYELYRLKDEDAEAILAALIGDRNEPQSTLGGRREREARARESLPIIEDAIARFLFEDFRRDVDRYPGQRNRMLAVLKRAGDKPDWDRPRPQSWVRKNLLRRLRSRQSVDRIYARASPGERRLLRNVQAHIKFMRPEADPNDKQQINRGLRNPQQSRRSHARAGRLLLTLIDLITEVRDEKPSWGCSIYSIHSEGGVGRLENGNIIESLSAVIKVVIRAMPPARKKGDRPFCARRIRSAKKSWEAVQMMVALPYLNQD